MIWWFPRSIMANLWPFLRTFYPLTSTNFVQTAWNFQRKWSLFSNIGCVKIIIDEKYLEIWHSSKEKILTEFEKKVIFAIFWHFLIPKFGKTVLNDLKNYETLFLYEFCMISTNDDNSTFFAYLTLYPLKITS